MIFHITTERCWQRARKEGQYTSKSLTTQGFIHCSSREQVVDVANYLYKGQKGLLLLLIEREKVAAPILFEDLYASGKKYPHIYGPLNLEAVQGVYKLDPDQQGFFDLPPELA